MVVAYWFAMILPTMAAMVRIAVMAVRADHKPTLGFLFFMGSPPVFLYNSRSRKRGRSACLGESARAYTQLALLDLVLTSL